MKWFTLVFVITITYSLQECSAQHTKGYTPKIEPCECAAKPDSDVKMHCGYLIVPESRKRPAGKTIKLPFSYVESSNPNKKKDPVLYTTGGPGGSSLGSVRIIYKRSLMKDRDYIAFEQRGTRYALPCLQCDEIGDAIKTAYRNNLPKDSLVVEGVKKCRQRLVGQGIDIAAYNTEESAADIEDLRIALHIDSLNLMGISYSGGLLMTVLKNYPWGVRSLVLDSPLPEFINIDQDEISNLQEALNTIFTKCERDSTDKVLYGGLKQRFEEYFTSISNKSFTIDYVEKGKPGTLHINYGRNELWDVVVNYISNFYTIKDVPYVITELIKGNHELYLKDLLDGVFNGGGPSGMRLSVYCSDKMAFANDALIQQQYDIHPYVAGYYINDVNRAMCKCWNVPAIHASTKQPFYSNVPVLLADGDTDPNCRPLYNDMIAHYMPNSQRLIFISKSHGPLLNTRGGDVFIGAFLDNPYKKLESTQKDVVVY